MIKNVLLIINSLLLKIVFMFFILSFLLVGVNYFASIVVRSFKLLKDFFHQKEEINRNLLKKYSPIIVSYIDKLNYNPNIAVVSGILSLEKKGLLKVEDNKIEQLHKNSVELNLSENYLLDNIQEGKIVIYKKMLWNKIKYDCLRNGLIEENELKISVSKIFIIIFLIELIGVILKDIGGIVSIFGMVIIFFIAFIFLYYFTIPNKTEKARIITSGLDELRKYLKKHKNLEDDDPEDLFLWDDYDIYKVLLKRNKEILKQYKKYFKIY